MFMFLNMILEWLFIAAYAAGAADSAPYAQARRYMIENDLKARDITDPAVLVGTAAGDDAAIGLGRFTILTCAGR